MKLADIRPYFDDEVGGLLEIGLLDRVRIKAEIAKGCWQDVIGGIQHVDAAIPEFSKVLRLEHDVPAVDLALGAEDSFHGFDVVADAGGAPHIICAKTVV